ncbi:hypothetical protein H5410_035009 [Solanum commersonii]|uniref:Uncharacterized protein n=1 Tax=Solanum commersonii TaxID=4109 RepID=A0A9J5Y017_SOLCO|nr:hypothetical protein H5410_035009 [Solanum commersonii]
MEGMEVGRGHGGPRNLDTLYLLWLQRDSTMARSWGLVEKGKGCISYRNKLLLLQILSVSNPK